MSRTINEEELIKSIDSHINTQESIRSFTHQFKNCESSLFSVGNANTTLITLSDELDQLKILYDFGRCTNRHKENECREKKGWSKVEENLSEIGEITDIDYIVLSHWDMDHINGFSHINMELNILGNSNLKRIIVPKPVTYSNFSRRLLSILLTRYSEKLYIVDHNASPLKINQSVTIYKGRGKAKCYTIQNNIGLSILIEFSSNTLLLTGDCEYGQIPIPISKIINILVIPHHGAYSKEVIGTKPIEEIIGTKSKEIENINLRISKNVNLFSLNGLSNKDYPKKGVIEHFATVSNKKIIKTCEVRVSLTIKI